MLARLCPSLSQRKKAKWSHGTEEDGWGTEIHPGRGRGPRLTQGTGTGQPPRAGRSASCARLRAVPTVMAREPAARGASHVLEGSKFLSLRICLPYKLPPSRLLHVYHYSCHLDFRFHSMIGCRPDNNVAQDNARLIQELGCESTW